MAGQGGDGHQRSLEELNRLRVQYHDKGITTQSQATQQLFFDTYSRQKRGPPTPVASSLNTPQEGATDREEAARSSDNPPLVVPVTLQDHTALQAVAGHMGVNINDPQHVEAWLQRPVANARDVLQLVRGYHEAVVRPEMYGMVIQLEGALRMMNDQIFATRSELNFMARENRMQQKHSSGLMLVTTGWPNDLQPPQRHYMLGWMISQLPEALTFLRNRGVIRAGEDHTAMEPEIWFQVLQVDPTTVPQSHGFFSAMTMLTFKAWDLRSAFLSRFGGQSGTPLYVDATTPRAGKHIRVSPCAPQWQRKLEAPLRVVIAVINAHEDFRGRRLIILWKSLTVMAPTDSPDFNPDHTAFARLFYEEQGGVFKGRLEVSADFARIMQAPATTQSSDGDANESLWTEKWNEVIWGPQLEMDKMEVETYGRAKAEARAGGRGTMYGGGRKHWSSTLLHNSYFSPYPFELEINAVDHIAYVWDEFCDKAGHPQEKVGDVKACTYGGKPAAAATADVDMDDEDITPPQQPDWSRFAKAAAPAAPKGAGRASKGS